MQYQRLLPLLGIEISIPLNSWPIRHIRVRSGKPQFPLQIHIAHHPPDNRHLRRILAKKRGIRFHDGNNSATTVVTPHSVPAANALLVVAQPLYRYSTRRLIQETFLSPTARKGIPRLQVSQFPSFSSDLGYFAKSSSGPNWVGLTNREAATPLEDTRAVPPATDAPQAELPWLEQTPAAPPA